MAIDFSRYASNYSGGATAGSNIMSPITQGIRDIAKARGSKQERKEWERADKKYELSQHNEAFAKWKKSYLSNKYLEAYGDGSIDNLKSLKEKAKGLSWDDQTESWKKFQAAARKAEVDGETYDFSKNIDAFQFAGDYKVLHKGVSDQWLSSISALELDPSVSSKHIRSIMKSNPSFFSYLSKNNTDAFRTGGMYESYVPQKTWTDAWAQSDYFGNMNTDSLGMVSAKLGGIGAGTIAAIWGGPKLFNYLKGKVGKETAEELIKQGSKNPTLQKSIIQGMTQNVTQGDLFPKGPKPQGLIDALKKGGKEVIKNGRKYVQSANGTLKSFASFATPGMSTQQIYNYGGGEAKIKTSKQLLNNLGRSVGGPEGVKASVKNYIDDVTKNLKKPIALPTGFKPSAVNVARGIGTMGIPMALGYGIEKFSGNENYGEIAGKSAFAGMALKPLVSSISAAIEKHGWKELGKKVLKVGGPKLLLKTIGRLGAGVLGGTVTGGAITAAMTAWAIKDIIQVVKIINEELGDNTQGNRNVNSSQNQQIKSISSNNEIMSSFSPDLKAAYKSLA